MQVRHYDLIFELIFNTVVIISKKKDPSYNYQVNLIISIVTKCFALSQILNKDEVEFDVRDQVFKLLNYLHCYVHQINPSFYNRQTIVCTV